MNNSMNNNILLSICEDIPINNREEFADFFTNISGFLRYVREEHSVEQDDYRYSLYMGKDGNIIIEEQPINDLALFFDVTRTTYTIDQSWRYIAMDWFDTVCGYSIWELQFRLIRLRGDLL